MKHVLSVFANVLMFTTLIGAYFFISAPIDLVAATPESQGETTLTFPTTSAVPESNVVVLPQLNLLATRAKESNEESAQALARFVRAPRAVSDAYPGVEYICLQGVPGTPIAGFARHFALFFTTTETNGTRAVIPLKVEFAGSQAQEFAGALPDGSTTNYFIGASSADWSVNLTGFRELWWREIYPGVDLLFKADPLTGQLKYEYWVDAAIPGVESRVGQILMRWTTLGTSGPAATPPAVYLQWTARSLTFSTRETILLQDGCLTAWLEGPQISREPLSFAWAARETPSGHETFYTWDSDPIVTSEGTRLVIDPFLTYSTFLGGSDYDLATDIAVDAAGCAYVVGETNSNDFPSTPGANDTSHNGNKDVFVVKLSSTGDSLEYATFLGGSSVDQGVGIAVDAAGCAYVAGKTNSSDFPSTPGANDPSQNGFYDVFVAKISASGSSLEYATFLGGAGSGPGYGDDWGGAIAVDAAGCAYVAGQTNSNDFPTTTGANDTSWDGYADGFVTKVSSDGATLAYSTFIGGWLCVQCITVDATGCAYVAGNWGNAGIPPVTPGANDTSYNGNSDVFVAKVSASGSSLGYGTFLGGSEYEDPTSIAVDSAGCAYVAGYTYSTDFPTTPGAFDSFFNGVNDAFVTKFSANGAALIYSTFLGGSSSDWGPYGIVVDATGHAYVAGNTYSTDFPTTQGAYDTILNGNCDAHATKFSTNGSALMYSTFLGGSGNDGGRGIALDSSGCAYIAGYTYSSDFPTTDAAYDTEYNGDEDIFVAKTCSLSNPTIIVNGPIAGALYGAATPTFNVTATEPELNATWYRVASSSTNHSFTPGTSTPVDVMDWASQPNGTVVLHFWANDTAGNVGYVNVTIDKDIVAPSITDTDLPSGGIYGVAAPSFALTIVEGNLDATWYSLDGGLTNSTCGLSGTLAAQWPSFGNGTVTVTFWANDTAGNVDSASVTVRKDVIAPSITGTGLTANQLCGAAAPTFTLTIVEANFNATWYSLDGGLTNTTCGLTGTLIGWDALGNGTVSVTFWANDTFGNTSKVEISLKKDIYAPVIQVSGPTAKAWHADPPAFTLAIDEPNLASIWYSLDGGATNQTLTSINGIIDAKLWNAMPLGQVTIRFYARDAAGNEASVDVVVVKILPWWAYVCIFLGIAIPVGIVAKVKLIPAGRKRLKEYKELAKLRKAEKIVRKQAEPAKAQEVEGAPIPSPLPDDRGVQRKEAEKVTIRRQYEYVGGKVRVKAKVTNPSEVGIMRVRITLDMPESFRLLRVEPPEYAREGPAVKLNDILPGDEKAVAWVLEPLICGKEKVQGSVTGTDARGSPFAISMEPLEVEVRCPMFVQPEEASLPAVQRIFGELPVKSERVYFLPRTMPPAEAFDAAKATISTRDVRFVGTFAAGEGGAFDQTAWFYGATKVGQKRYVLTASVSEQDRAIRIFSACDDEAGCTGFLAETGAAVRQALAQRGAASSEETVRELICEKCGGILPRGPDAGRDVKCPDCGRVWTAADFER